MWRRSPGVPRGFCPRVWSIVPRGGQRGKPLLPWLSDDAVVSTTEVKSLSPSPKIDVGPLTLRKSSPWLWWLLQNQASEGECMLVALIEDHQRMADIFLTALQARGHSVTHFLDGASFFASLQTHSYEVVVVDFHLPGNVSGLQVITFLQEQRPVVSTLVISAASETVLRSLQTLYPRVPILRKPFPLQVLFQQLEALQDLP
jgi:CheY-like chemotaxis protein